MRLPHTAACSSGVEDTVTVNDYPGGNEVFLTASGSRGGTFSVFLTPADAREFARAIKKAAKRAEKNGNDR